MSSILVCPVCQQPVITNASGLNCVNRHQFDQAKQGYYNLLPVQHKHSKNPGDTPHSLLNRRLFLSAGWYSPLQTAIEHLAQQYAQGKTWLDVGCGEGYYSLSVAPYVKHIIGVDIAKKAVALAAKQAQNLTDTPSTWLVASSYKLPIADNCIEVCSSIFAPIPIAEAARVLSAQGLLVIVRAHAQHLLSFRQALFTHITDTDYSASHAQLAEQGFKQIADDTICAPLRLDSSAVNQLMDMTPYAYKASIAAKQSLLKATDRRQFITEAVFQLEVWQLA